MPAAVTAIAIVTTPGFVAISSTKRARENDNLPCGELDERAMSLCAPSFYVDIVFMFMFFLEQFLNPSLHLNQNPSTILVGSAHDDMGEPLKTYYAKVMCCERVAQTLRTATNDPTKPATGSTVKTISTGDIVF